MSFGCDQVFPWSSLVCKKVAIVNRRLGRSGLIELRVVVEVVVEAKNSACFTIHNQGCVGSNLPVGKLVMKSISDQVIAIVCTPFEGDVDVAGVLKIPGGISTGIDHCEQVTVFCGDDCGNPKVLGSTVPLRKKDLPENLRNHWKFKRFFGNYRV